MSVDPGSSQTDDPKVMWDARWTPREQDEAVALADKAVAEADAHLRSAADFFSRASTHYIDMMQRASMTRRLRHDDAMRRRDEA